jgi:hypothetical protein
LCELLRRKLNPAGLKNNLRWPPIEHFQLHPAAASPEQPAEDYPP